MGSPKGTLLDMFLEMMVEDMVIKMRIALAAALLAASAFPALAAPPAANIGLENVVAAGASSESTAFSAMVMNDSIDMRGATGQGYLGDRPADGATHAVYLVILDDSIGTGAVMVLADIGDRPADGGLASLGNINPSIVDAARTFAALPATNLAAAGAANSS